MKIPGYQIKNEIGKGGMATVYLATQESLDRTVALKVLASSIAANDRFFCERFFKEAKIIAQLSHRHIVTIYDVGCVESRYYIAMEYLSAGSLKQRIKQKRGLESPLTIIRQLADALGFAHSRGFVHRDVKPANVLFRDEGTAVLTDFGVAKAMGSQTQLTATGFAIGTPEYMSPEQALGKSVDAAADLYSLGIVLYEMLMGKRPFVGEDAFTTALMHMKEPIPRLPDEFVSYEPILNRLLAKEPTARFQSARQLIDFIDSGFPDPWRQIESHPTPRQASLAGATSSGHKKSAAAADKRERAFPSMMGKAAAVMILVAVLVGAAVYVTGRESVEDILSLFVPFAPESEFGDRRSLSSDARREKVARLLEVAEAHAAVGRLWEPPGSNAYEAYKLVLQYDPGNESAARAVQQLEQQKSRAENHTSVQ